MADIESPYENSEDREDELIYFENVLHNGDTNISQKDLIIKCQYKFTSFEITFDDKNISLQKAFIKFKQRKKREISCLTTLVRELPNSEEDMMRFRLHFLDQARKYLGIPYAKKYWTPKDPEFSSTIFLDCCGLVRRIMTDLKNEFGFCIGPWNQAYQFDTLPIILNSLEEVKPGDLVFTAATYYKNRKKQQKHDLTHVEILLGQGTKTIASRWRKGKIQEFDDYRFESTVYHSPRYIFKSIDTWIRGICKSHCSEHSWVWRPERFVPSERSVFASNSDSETSDQNDLQLKEN